MDCKSTNIRKGILSKKICPNCKSDNIETIIDKRNKLIKDFQRDILNFRYGYVKLKNFIDECKVLRDELITLRNLGYKHDGKIEQSLLWVYNTINKTKNDILYTFQNSFDLIKSKILRFFSIDTWNPKNFYEIETIIEQIREKVNMFKYYVDQSLKPAEDNLKIIKTKISAIQYYKMIYDEYKSELHFITNELPVCAFKRINFIKFENKELPNRRGVLFITNKRLIFIHKKGLIKKVKEELFNIRLNEINNAIITGRIFKKLKIYTNLGTITFKANDKIMSAIIHYLKISMNFTKYSNDDIYLTQRLGELNFEISDLKYNINDYITRILHNDNQNLLNNEKIKFLPKINSNNIDVNINDKKLDEKYDSIYNNRAYRNHDEISRYIRENNVRQSNNNLRYQSRSHSIASSNHHLVESPPMPKNIGNNNFISNNLNNNQNLIYKTPNNQVHQNYIQPQTPQTSNFPQPGSINITIPIAHNTTPPRPPMAQIVSSQIPFQTQFNNNNFINEKDKPIPITENEYQHRNRNNCENRNEITTLETRPIMKLYEDKFSIEKTLEKIDNLFNNGIITPEVYFKQYRPLLKELYTINKMIEMKEKNIEPLE